MENKKIHQIDAVEITDDEMKITVDNNEYKFILKNISKRLSAANEQQKRHFEISPSGYGIHWPEIDEDLSIDSLIGIKNNIERRPSHRRRAV